MGIEIPAGIDTFDLKCGNKKITLTSLQRVFWPKSGKTKRDLLLYYAAVSSALLPHLRDRATVLKRYPSGIEGDVFLIKRTPAYRPQWLETCPIEQKSGSVIDFPMAQDLASLLWIVNLGCIDLNPWYSRCDDVNRPDFLHFDLDPVPPAGLTQVREVALLVRAYLGEKGIDSFAKMSGSRGIHIYLPIYRNPTQKEVWRAAKKLATHLEKWHADIVTAQYRIPLRPAGRVVVDYNQNAWGRTLASVYSVRPTPDATVSAPVTWDEVEAGISPLDLTTETVPDRIARFGDLFKPVLRSRSRYRLELID